MRLRFSAYTHALLLSHRREVTIRGVRIDRVDIVPVVYLDGMFVLQTLQIRMNILDLDLQALDLD